MSAIEASAACDVEVLKKNGDHHEENDEEKISTLKETVLKPNDDLV